MKSVELFNFLDELAPGSYKESYDNVGLLVKGSDNLTGVLVSLDCTEEVVNEAIERGLNCIVSHHPLIFNGLKSILGRTDAERALLKAIRHQINIYAIHTNLDNVLHGVNQMMAEKLELSNCSVLREQPNTLCKLITYVPHDHAEQVCQAMFDAGAGTIGNYSDCSFRLKGTGTFKAMDGASPFLGEINERHEEPETRIELIFPIYKKSKILNALKKAHPYEEVAYELIRIENTRRDVGSGLIGELHKPLPVMDFLEKVKSQFNCAILKNTSIVNQTIQKVALCGGAGIFLLEDAKNKGADVFITGDVKYHDFFNTDEKIMLIDTGHFESEQFTKDLLFLNIQKKFPTFAVLNSVTLTNPVKYY